MPGRHLLKNRRPILGIDTDTDIVVLLCYCKNNVFLPWVKSFNLAQLGVFYS